MPFSRVCCVIPGILEQLARNRNSPTDGHVVVIHTNLMRKSPGVKTRSRRTAQRVRAIRLGEVHTTGGQPIEVGRFQPPVAHHTRRIDPLLIRGNNKNVRPSWRFRTSPSRCRCGPSKNPHQSAPSAPPVQTMSPFCICLLTSKLFKSSSHFLTLPRPDLKRRFGNLNNPDC